MKRALILVLLCQLSLYSFAQDYSFVEIHNPTRHLRKLMSLGLALDHSTITENGIAFVVSQRELDKIRRAQIDHVVLVADAETEYVRPEKFGRNDEQATCVNEKRFRVPIPENFMSGSLNGHLTYDQMLEQLDLMREKYPDLISERMPIGDFRTHEFRAIYHVRISTTPDVDADKPEILYTALHHAREPMSMTQLIFYMWYLLENYESSPIVGQLLNQTEMYFVPCINPDGYIYNQVQRPEGGGLWRKNRRANDDGTYGVDLNRNYSFQWGFDDFGSSPEPGSEVYRGPEPFSEPETQAIRHLCLTHEFKIALNYHSYGNFLIYPFGYTEEEFAVYESFDELSRILTSQNHYVFGTGLETVSYLTNGDSDDWMFGDTEDKPEIYALTPEVGSSNDWFWPEQNRILPICQENVFQNLQAASFLLNNAFITDESPTFVTDMTNDWPFKITKFGIDETGIQISVNPITSNVSFDVPSKFYFLDILGTTNDLFTYHLNDVNSGDEILFEVISDNGFITMRDTIRKIYTTPQELFANQGTVEDFDVSGWLSEWGQSTFDYFSAPTSLADSPNGNYLPGSISTLQTKELILLEADDEIFLSYRAKWDIKAPSDYFQVSISTDGENFIPLCGNHSTLGTRPEVLEQPIYTGKQTDWVVEEIDISGYAGQYVSLRFVLSSNDTDTRDGIYIDDIAIRSIDQQISTNIEDHFIGQVKVYPNPTTELIQIEINDQQFQFKEFEVDLRNTLGQNIQTWSIQATDQINVSSITPGLYYMAIRSVDNQTIGQIPIVINSF